MLCVEIFDKLINEGVGGSLGGGGGGGSKF